MGESHAKGHPCKLDSYLYSSATELDVMLVSWLIIAAGQSVGFQNCIQFFQIVVLVLQSCEDLSFDHSKDAVKLLNLKVEPHLNPFRVA